MSRLTEPRAGLATFLLAIAATLAMAMFAAPVVSAGVPLNLSDNYSSECKVGTSDNIDPVTVLFRGTQASAGNAASEVKRVAEWEEEGWGDQLLKVRQPNAKRGCRHVDFQPASEPEWEPDPVEFPFILPGPLAIAKLIKDSLDGNPFTFIDVPSERFHVRLWFVDSSIEATERKTLGTPHFEEFKEWERGKVTCKGIELNIGGETVSRTETTRLKRAA
jgi:hypothetical protein